MRLFVAALVLFGLIGRAHAQSAEVLTYSVGDTLTNANGAVRRNWTSTGWFSPEVKWFLKLTSTAPNAPELELVSYNLK